MDNLTFSVFPKNQNDVQYKEKAYIENRLRCLFYELQQIKEINENFEIALHS